MRAILSIVFIVTAFLLFFGMIKPLYQETLALREQERQFEEALSRSKELQELRDQLITKFNSFATEDLERLEKLLPDNIDNVRLVLDLDSLARSHDMRIGDVSLDRSGVSEDREAQSADASEEEEETLGSVILSFTAQTTYETFLAFLADLERSLRLVDIVDLNITPLEQGYLFKVGLQTYWLE